MPRMFSRKVSPSPPRTLGDLRICSSPAMSRPTSKTRWVTSPSWPSVPCTAPTTSLTCWSCCWTPVPTWPSWVAIWPLNWCISRRSDSILARCERALSSLEAWISRWSICSAWSGRPLAASRSLKRPESPKIANAVRITPAARTTSTMVLKSDMLGLPPFPVQAHHAEPARRTDARVAAVQALPGHPRVAEREIVLHRVVGIQPAQTRRDLLGHLPVPGAAAREPHRARHVLDMRVHGDQERRRRDVPPEREVGRLASHHPAKVEMQALARPAGRRPREPVPVAIREPVAREHRSKILSKKGVDEALERRTHVAVLRREAFGEEGAQRAVADQQPLRRQTEGDQIARPVEAVMEALEEPRVLCRVESQDEAVGRFAHSGQRPVHPGTEELDPAIGHAGRQEPDHFDIGGPAVAEKGTDGVLLGAGRPVELPIEPLERLLEPGQ